MSPELSALLRPPQVDVVRVRLTASAAKVPQLAEPERERNGAQHRWVAPGLQIVPGVAVPLGVGPNDGEHSLFFYLSLEHAFRRGK